MTAKSPQCFKHRRLKNDKNINAKAREIIHIVGIIMVLVTANKMHLLNQTTELLGSS